MRNKTANRGYTFLEAVAVIAIIAILFGLAMVRLVPTKRKEELEMAANLVQSALVEAREKSQAPKPSTTIDQPSDVNGYGVKLNLGSNTQFTLFKDKTTGTLNRWDALDEEITTYKFSDNNIANVKISKFIKVLTDDTSVEDATVGDRSIVFKYSEIPSQRAIYFDGDSTLKTLSIFLEHTVDSSQEKVTIDFLSGEIKIELVVAPPPPPPIIIPPSISWWKFDEGSGTVAQDSSGSNNGTVNGASWTTTAEAKVGNSALRFNRNNFEHVRVPDSASLNITGDITIEAWVKFTDVDGPRQAIVGKKEGWASYALRINQINLATGLVEQRKAVFFVEGGDSTKRYQVFSTTLVENNKWYHIIGVRRGTDIEIWINGVKENTVPAPEMAQNDYDLFIGGDPQGSPPGDVNYPFSGIIDEVKIYNVALSDEQILAIYNNTK